MMNNNTVQDITGMQFNVWIHPVCKPEQVLHTVNGCCEGRPVIITSNLTPDGRTNYSAQCACGGWCTTGKDTAEGAAREWMRMNGRTSHGSIRSAVTGRRGISNGKIS